MAKFINLTPETLKQLRTVDPRLVSYHIEMTEVTGGTFWRAYTPGQIAGTEEYQSTTDMSDVTNSMALMQHYPPIDLYNQRARMLANALGSVWVRVSGTWASKTYYDFDGSTGGKAPEGFNNVLTKEQWIGLLDFVKAIGAKLIISLANCIGIHSAHEPWHPGQAEVIFRFSEEYGVSIDAVEFTNEPNSLEMGGLPKGYTVEDFVRDQDICNAWVRENYPNCLIVGPCSADTAITRPGNCNGGADLGMPHEIPTESLLKNAQVKMDVLSYHCYNGLSERLSGTMSAGHWAYEKTLSEEYLGQHARVARDFALLRDKYMPGGQMWVTETADAAGGGNTWASTYTEALRFLNEIGSFATVTDGVIFHNTFASSDYGMLEHGTFNPRPIYYAGLLWNTLMGTTVYDSGIEIQEGAHGYCHSRKDGKDGCAYLVINNSKTDVTTVTLPKDADRYTLDGNGNMRNTVMYLNGNPLVLGENDELPELAPVKQAAGTVELAPGSCTFFVL